MQLLDSKVTCRNASVNNAMSKTETLLSALRDIQEPAAPESLSLWLIAANVILIMVLAMLYFLRKNRLQEGWRRESRREILRAKETEPQQGVVLLAKLLRKIVIHRTNNHSALQGDAWLNELNTLFSTQWFTEGEGRVFGTALYQKTVLSPTDLNSASNKILQLVNDLPLKASLSTAGS